MNKQQAGNVRRATDAAKLWDSRKREIVWLYEGQGFSQEKIADYYGVALHGIQKAMARLGIKSRSRANYGKRNGSYKDGTESTLYRLMIQKDKCATCAATERLVIHHKNFDHYDNHLENLQVLCESCHNRLHRKEWWRLKKSAL